MRCRTVFPHSCYIHGTTQSFPFYSQLIKQSSRIIIDEEPLPVTERYTLNEGKFYNTLLAIKLSYPLRVNQI